MNSSTKRFVVAALLGVVSFLVLVAAHVTFARELYSRKIDGLPTRPEGTVTEYVKPPVKPHPQPIDATKRFIENYRLTSPHDFRTDDELSGVRYHVCNYADYGGIGELWTYLTEEGYSAFQQEWIYSNANCTEG